MRNLFLRPEQFQNGQALIDGDNYHHLANVLRAHEGEELRLLDNSGRAWKAILHHSSRKQIIAEILEETAAPPEPHARLIVAQAPGKGDRFEQVLLHATEMGVSGFIPLLTSRTVVKLDTDNSKEKLIRWRQTLKGAAEQSGRAKIPDIYSPRSFCNVVQMRNDYNRAYLLHQDGAELIHSDILLPGESALLLIGPEGGFSQEELQAAKDANVGVISLGDWTLRTETAALAAASRLLWRTY
jgi:16S rRNA (uracil1498-N3)-methyltransferase